MTRKLTPERVDQEIASYVKRLKSQAVTPVVVSVDEEAARAEEQELKDARRAESLRRLKSPVLTQRQADGSVIFKHDIGIVDDGYIADVRP